MKPIKSLNKKLWKLFSQYTRLRTADDRGLVRCFTCNSPHYWKDTDAGHFIHGKNKPTGFDERNVNVQCKRCNKWLSGNLIIYEQKLIEKYGKKQVEEMKELSHKVTKRDRSWYEFHIEIYKEKVKKEMERLGLK